MATDKEMVTAPKFNESVKNALRDYYVYGFKKWPKKSKASQTQRADWQRLQAVLPDYLTWSELKISSKADASDNYSVRYVTVDSQAMDENPFLRVKSIIEKIKDQVDIIVVDFHAEATAEKIAMGYYLDGLATIVYGTHTHVQTADEAILPSGTGYITDIGMTGPKNSVIGMDIKVSFKRFETTLPERYHIASGDCKFNGVIFEVGENNKVCNIERIYLK